MKGVVCSLEFFFLIIQLWQQSDSHKFEMLICVTATVSSGENELVVYVFPYRVPHCGFGQKKKERKWVEEEKEENVQVYI